MNPSGLAQDDEDLLQNLMVGQGRKSNSLNDLLHGAVAKNSGKKNPYANVESKVKNYIASLPAPNSRRKTFKKHTSMPGYIGDCGIGHSEASITSCLQLEQEYSQYRRQSEHTISELEKQVQVAVTMISQANNENHDLMDRIEHLEKECYMVLNRPTPVPSQVTVAQLAVTPRKAMPINRLLGDDTTGSFIGQSLTVTAGTTTTTTTDTTTDSHSRGVSPVGTKRNLSFNSSSDLTRRSGTDSGINTSDGNEIQVHEVEGLLSGRSGADEEDEMMPVVEKRRKKLKKRKRIRKYMARLLCCVTVDAAAAEAGPMIMYKKM